MMSCKNGLFHKFTFVQTLLCLLVAGKTVSGQLGLSLASAEMKYWNLRGRTLGYELNYPSFPGQIRFGSFAGSAVLPIIKHKGRGAWHYPYLNSLQLPPTDGTCILQFGSTIGPTTANYGGTVKTDPREPLGLNVMSGILEYSENPLIQAGSYMAVLATEWHLLARDGSSTVATEQELLHLLNMIDRLDLAAEPSYGKSGVTDGFMLRDDVPEDFALMHMDVKTDLIYSNFACPVQADHSTALIDPAYDAIADLHCEPLITNVPGTGGVNTGVPSQLRVNVASGDELTGILFGLVFIKKFVASSATVQGINLVQKAANISDRIIQYARNGMSIQVNLGNLGSVSTFGSWVLADPNSQPICKGPIAANISWPMAAVAGMISGNNEQNAISASYGRLLTELYMGYWRKFPHLSAPIVNTVPLPLKLKTALDLNGSTINLFFAPPGALNFNPISAANHEFNYINFARLVACTGQASVVKTPMLVPTPYLADGKGKKTLGLPAHNLEKYLYDLIGATFNNYAPVGDAQFWLNQFDQLKCYGCCYQTYSGAGYNDCDNYENNPTTMQNDPWNQPNRWQHVPDDYFTDRSTHIANSIALPHLDPLNFDEQRSAEFSGIDYMLAYNLFRIKFTAGGTRSRLVRNFIGVVPTGGVKPIGDALRPLQYKAVFNITSSAGTIKSNGVAYFKAGSSIVLEPGFTTQFGAVLDMQIKKYDCTPVATYGGYQNKKNDTIGDYYFDELDTVIVDNVLPELAVPADSSDYYMQAYNITETSDSTTIVTLHPDWQYDSLGELVFVPGSNKMWPSAAKDVSIYPIPAVAELNLKVFVPAAAGAFTYQVLDVTNKQLTLPAQVKHYHQYQHVQFDVSGLSAGTYFIEVAFGGQARRFKFTKH
jgi:hypothetical protein